MIIHRGKFDIVCKTQQDLKMEMKKGLVFEAPPTPAESAKWNCEIWDIVSLIKWGFQKECCLCPIDLEETAKINGYNYSKDDPKGEFDPFDTHFYLGVK